MSIIFNFIKNKFEQQSPTQTGKPVKTQGQTQTVAPVAVPLNGKDVHSLKDSKAKGFTFLKAPVLLPNAENKQNGTCPIADSTGTSSTSTHTVPIVKSEHVNQSNAVTPGLGVEKSTENNSHGVNENKSHEDHKHHDHNHGPFVKTGESICERMDRFYDGKFSKANIIEKEKMIRQYAVDYYGKMKNKTKDQIEKLQLTDFRKLLHNTNRETNLEDRRAAIRAIPFLKRNNQGKIGEEAIVGASSEKIKNASAVEVAGCTHKCAVENQVSLTKVVVNSNCPEAMVVSANHLSENDKTVQAKVAEVLQKPDIIEVNKAIIDQNPKCDESQQLAIHEIVSGSKHTETVEYAASNIYLLKEKVQPKAAEVTMATKNEAAVSKMAEQYPNYAKSAQTQIKTMINNSSYTRAKEIVANPELQKRAAYTPTTTTTTTKSSVSMSSSSTLKSASDFKNISDIIKSKAPNKKALIMEKIKSMSSAEQLGLLSIVPKSYLPGLLSILIRCNPSAGIMSKAIDRSDELSDRDKLKFMESVNSVYLSKQISSKIGLVNVSTQKLVVEKSANRGTLGNINRDQLAESVKKDYDEYIKKG